MKKYNKALNFNYLISTRDPQVHLRCSSCRFLAAPTRTAGKALYIPSPLSSLMSVERPTAFGSIATGGALPAPASPLMFLMRTPGSF